MAKLHLNPWQRRSYGVYTTGYAESRDRRVPLQIRSPHDELSDTLLPKIINFNGLTAGAESMQTPAYVAAHLGYAAITFDYTNTDDHSTPVNSNAHDGVVILDALDADEYRLLGLSMGGAVATIAAATTDRPVTNLDLVSPGGFVDDITGMNLWSTTRAFQREYIDDSFAALHHPFTATSVALDSLANCYRRPRAVIAELRQLLRETAYSHLEELRETSPNTVVTLAHCDNDKLVPGKDLMRSMNNHTAADGRRLYDIDIPYKGIHTTLVYTPELTESILLAEAKLALGKQP